MTKPGLPFFLIAICILTLCLGQVQAGPKKGMIKIIGDSVLSKKMKDGSKRTLHLSLDPSSEKHVVLTEKKESGTIVCIRTYLVKGNKISLSKWDSFKQKELVLRDGVSSTFKQGKMSRQEYFNQGSREKQIFFNDQEKIRDINYYSADKVTRFEHYAAEEQLSVRYDVEQIEGGHTSMNGLFQQWNTNGELAFEGTFRNGVKDGVFKRFESGQIVAQGQYKRGKLKNGEPVVNVEQVYLAVDTYPEMISQSEQNFLKLLLKRKVELLVQVSSNGEAKLLKIMDGERSEEGSDLIRSFNQQCRFQPALLEAVPVHFKGWMTLEKANQNTWTVNWREISFNPNVMDGLAHFVGGETALRTYIAKNVKYPVKAQKAGEQGRTYVGFVVDVNGAVTKVKVARSSGSYALDEAAMNVVREMPVWRPGFRNANFIKVRYNVPINFHLR